MRRVEANEALEEDDKSCKQTADFLQTTSVKNGSILVKYAVEINSAKLIKNLSQNFGFGCTQIFSILFQVVEFLS